jgi:hypothetical protein
MLAVLQHYSGIQGTLWITRLSSHLVQDHLMKLTSLICQNEKAVVTFSKQFSDLEKNELLLTQILHTSKTVSCFYYHLTEEL